MQVVVNGLLTNYIVKGSGKTVLLLHGWGDNLDTFTHLAQSLSLDYKVVSLDLPGFGKTDAPDLYSLEKYSNFVKKFLEKTDNSEIFCVIGHSNGGAIAIKALSNDIIKCKKLILLASSGIRSENKNTKKLTRLVFKTAKVPTKLLSKKMQSKIKKSAYKTVGSDMFVAENMQDTFKAVVSEDLQAQSSKITVDTLLIYGDKDQSTPLRYGRLYNDKIKRSELVVIENATHFLHHEKPDEVEALVKSFLDKA